MAHVALDLKIYDILVESKEPVPLETLVERTRTESVLLGALKLLKKSAWR